MIRDKWGGMGKPLLSKIRYDMTEYLKSRWRIQRSRGLTEKTYALWCLSYETAGYRKLWTDWRGSRWRPDKQPCLTVAGWVTRYEARGLRSEARPNRTGFIGVHPKGNRFIALIKVKGKTRYVGSAGTPEEAAKMRDLAAKQNLGKTAMLNFHEKP